MHQFIFTPGIWIGEGRIIFSSSPESIRFYTRWTVDPLAHDIIVARQIVEIQGAGENVVNTFTLSSISPDKFNIQLENELVGKIKGTGLLTPSSIAWEFRGHDSFEGFEIARLEENGDYMVHAEYASLDSHRTTIDGRVWKKTTKS